MKCLRCGNPLLRETLSRFSATSRNAKRGIMNFTREELLQLQLSMTNKAYALMGKKNQDYTGGGGVFANFEAAGIFGVHRVKGALVRMTDKMQRINSFIENGILQVSDESVEDTLLDIINYAILIGGMIKEEKRIPEAGKGGQGEIVSNFWEDGSLEWTMAGSENLPDYTNG